MRPTGRSRDGFTHVRFSGSGVVAIQERRRVRNQRRREVRAPGRQTCFGEIHRREEFEGLEATAPTK